MTAGLAPGVYVAPPPPAAAVDYGIDIAGLIGVAERGPVAEAVAIEGWPQFVARFGEFQPNAFLAYAVRGFFDNGGRRCHVVRVSAPEHATRTSGVQPTDGVSTKVADSGSIRAGALVTLRQEAATAAVGAQPADRRSTKVASAAGFHPGSKVLIRQPGKAPVIAIASTVDRLAKVVSWPEQLPAAIDLALPFSLETRFVDRRLVASVAGNTLTWDHPLDDRFDLGLRIDIAAGSSSASASLPDEDGLPLLQVKAASPGQWGDSLSIRLTATTASETRTRRRGTVQPANLLTLERVFDLTVGSTLVVLQDGIAEVRRTIVRIDPATGEVELDANLPGTFNLADAAAGVRPIGVRRLAFTLSVSERGRLREVFADLDLPTSAASKNSRVNQLSELIRIERLPGPGLRWVDPGSGLLRFGTVTLEGGRDGIAMLRPADFTGRSDEQERRGLRQFELEDESAAIAIPDAMIPPLPAVMRSPPEPEPQDPCHPCPPPRLPLADPLPPPMVEASPTFSPDDVRAIQSALLEHCESRGDRIALLDPPLALGVPDEMDVDSLRQWRQLWDSSYAAAYFPWLSVRDPIAIRPETERRVPASGHALGQFALADQEPGRPAPANRPVQWTIALPRVLDDAEHGLLNDAGINVIRSVPGRGIRIMGARTLSSHPDWKQLSVRRFVIGLKRMLDRQLRWAVFEPNDRSLLETIVALVENYLEGEWIAQRLAGKKPGDAFYVTPLTLADDFDNGHFVLEIGIAPSVPAEFIVLRLSRTEDRLELAELTSAGGLTP